jgi:hypothetical protein
MLSSVYTLPCPLSLMVGNRPLSALPTRKILQDGSQTHGPTPEYLEHLSIIFTSFLRAMRPRPRPFPTLFSASVSRVLLQRVLPWKAKLRKKMVVDTHPAGHLLPDREGLTATTSVSSSSPRVNSRGRGELGLRSSSGLISSRARARAFRRLRCVQASCSLMMTKARNAGPRPGCQLQFQRAVASAQRASRDLLYSRSRARFGVRDPPAPSFIQALWMQCALWDVSLAMTWGSSLVDAAAAQHSRRRGAD